MYNMSPQRKLFEKPGKFVVVDMEEENKPTEVKVIRNRFLTPGAVVIEEITRKRWIRPITS